MHKEEIAAMQFLNYAYYQTGKFAKRDQIINQLKGKLNQPVDLRTKSVMTSIDSDGDNAKNMELSEQRAMAIKTALVRDFNVNEDALTAEGKGETQPSDPNTTVAGKANNRRVEFIKL